MAGSSEAASARVRNALLATLTTIGVAFALKATASVTLPLAFALFLMALHWPVQRKLRQFLPSGIAVVVTLVVFVAVMTAFGWALAESADEVNDHAGRYEAKLGELVDQAKASAETLGFSMPEGDTGPSLSALAGPLRSASKNVFEFIGGAVLVVAFLGLGLLEVPKFRAKLAHIGSRPPKERAHTVVRRIAVQFQRYLLVRTGIGLLTGVATALGAWIIGLDFWYIWGILNFLLNYIPTLGSIIGVIPPVLFALLQFGTLGMAALTMAVVGGVQLVMGNWIDPLVQGKYLSLSSLVVLLSVTFWGWLWGIAGAFISVPLTIVVVLACREFDSTRWIAVLLADMDERSDAEPPATQPETAPSSS